MARRTLPDADTLREYFDYDEKIGNLTFRIRLGRRRPGDNAITKGGSKKDGATIDFRSGNYMVHRLICRWWYGNRFHENASVTHVDGNKLNNKIENLWFDGLAV